VRVSRTKSHSSHGGRKAHLNFELKDAPNARGLRPSQILDFKVQIRSGQPCVEWERAAGGAISYWRKMCANDASSPFETLPLAAPQDED
jgi:hypothetical protein